MTSPADTEKLQQSVGNGGLLRPFSRVAESLLDKPFDTVSGTVRLDRDMPTVPIIRPVPVLRELTAYRSRA